MKTIYLHIGTFKTGTSSIQGFLGRNRNALAQQGYLVPSSAAPGHHELPISLIKEYSSFRGAWPKVEESSGQLWKKLLNEIESSQCDKVVISAETFCDLVNEHCRDSSEKMGKLVAKYLRNYEVKVVCYVRAILPYMQSMYGETIKITPSHRSFEEQVGIYAKHRSLHLSPTIYLDFYEKLFGRQAMIVREYKREKLANGDVVHDFAEVIGLPTAIIETLLGESTKGPLSLNTSIDPRQMDLKRAFNLAGVHGPDLNRQIAELLKGAARLADEHNQGSEGQLDASLYDLICEEQLELNTRYGLEMASPEPDLYAVPDVPRNVDDLYTIALLGLVISQSQDSIRLAKQNAKAIEQLQQQNQKLLSEFSTRRPGFLEQLSSSLKTASDKLLVKLRRH